MRTYLTLSPICPGKGSMSHSPIAFAMALLAALALVFPPGVTAQAQRAGQVSRSVPKADIQRGAQQVSAAAQTPLFWQDVVQTDRGGRARIALDDGSILNVGSESSLAITKHDANSQQTELDLAYGRVRANVVKLSRPGAEFKVKTRTAVAGVVGTDFFLSFINDVAQLIVYEGIVQLCNLAGQCVAVGAGQMTMQRGNNPPDQPTNVSPAQSMQAAQNTQVGATAGAAAGAGLSTLTILAVVGAVVVSVVVATTINRGDGTTVGGCVASQGVSAPGTSAATAVCPPR